MRAPEKQARELHARANEHPAIGEFVMTMVVGMFETLVNAQRAVSDLVDSGYAPNAISVLVRDGSAYARHDDGSGEQGALARATKSVATTGVLAGGPLGRALCNDTHQPPERAVMDTLAHAGLKPAAARFFADAICNGAIMVAVHCPAREVRAAREILDIYTGEEVAEAPAWRSSVGGGRPR
jgi:hypothetical protein